MHVAMATSAADPDQSNEDFIGVVPNAAVLLDGAGISGIESICCHGVAWYTHRLGGTLLGRLSLDDGQDLTALLGEAVDQVADAHRRTCDIADPSSPSATVLILRLSGDRADFLLLGDSVLVLDQAGDVPLVITDRREVTIGHRYRTAMAAAMEGSPEYHQARRDYIETLRANRNQPGGFWVAKDKPQAAAEARTGSRSIRDLASAVLLSNGASRIVDRFGLADWPGVLALLRTAGPTEIIRRVREAEVGDTNDGRRPRGGIHDDATLAYCTRLGS